MKEKQITAYYCDHCKMHRHTKKSMEKHEPRCTSNPARVCAMCEKIGAVSVGAGALKDMINEGASIEELTVAAGGCPICVISGIKQSGVMKNWQEDPAHPSILKWNFKEALADAWDKVNRSIMENEMRGGGY